MGWGPVGRGVGRAWSAWTPAEREAVSSASAAQLPAASVAWWIGSFTRDDYGLPVGGLGMFCLCLFLPLVLPVLGLLHSTLQLMPGWLLAEWLERPLPRVPRWGRRLLGTAAVGVVWAVAAALAVDRPFAATAVWCAALGVWPVAWAAFVRRRAEAAGRSWGCLGLWFRSASASAGLCVLTLLGGLLATAAGLVEQYEPPKLSRDRLAGVWRGEGGAVLRLLPGGRAEAADLPMNGPGWDAVTCDGTGRWLPDSEGRAGVRVTVAGCGDGTTWTIGGTRREPELFVALGDPDAGDLRILKRA
ncbi:hypothetical protein ACIF8T_31980 [Streptomyces sp. NPDC085946]|uniref:hypothetical protein n=1 Tax=Streptomyces sp. NPDC085946 TaxID=3365744 RepID=UPI0037D78AF6